MSNKIEWEANTPENGMKPVCPMPYSEMIALCLTYLYHKWKDIDHSY